MPEVIGDQPSAGDSSKVTLKSLCRDGIACEENPRGLIGVVIGPAAANHWKVIHGAGDTSLPTDTVSRRTVRDN